MGLKVVSLNQVVLERAPKLEDIGGLPDIAVLSAGSKRHAYFSRVIKPIEEVRTIYYGQYQNESSTTHPSSEINSDDYGQDLVDLANEIANPNRPLKVFIDVSCLPRTVIAQVFAGIAKLAEETAVELKVGYSLAKYATSPQVWAKPNRSICPVHPSFSGWTSEGASQPLDIVVGLGYERGKALGAVEYLEPRDRWVFVPESPIDAYLKEVKVHNKILVEGTEGRKVVYQVLSPVDTYFSLRSLVQGIANSARPVLLPFGPKIFFAVNLLVAMSCEEAAVWHVNGESDDYGERNASRHSVVLSCLIQRGEVLKELDSASTLE